MDRLWIRSVCVASFQKFVLRLCYLLSPTTNYLLSPICKTWPIAINSCLGQSPILQADVTLFIYFRLNYGPKYINLVIILLLLLAQLFMCGFYRLLCNLFIAFCCWNLRFFTFLLRRIEILSHMLPGEVFIFWLVDAESFTSVVSRLKKTVTFFIRWDFIFRYISIVWIVYFSPINFYYFRSSVFSYVSS